VRQVSARIVPPEPFCTWVTRLLVEARIGVSCTVTPAMVRALSVRLPAAS
jgi:hypothetical protein